MDTDDGLGDTIATHVFDVGLARSLVLASGLDLGGCIAGLVLLTTMNSGGWVTSVLMRGVLAVAALIGAWGLLVGATRLRRRDDRFVLHRFGLARHHRSGVTSTRWVDIAALDQSGSRSGSRASRWMGSDYTCRIERRDGTVAVFDNFIVDAEGLGDEIARRSLP